MRVAHLVFSFNTGGIENLIVDIINNWKSGKILLVIINNSMNCDLLEKIHCTESAEIICLNRPVGGGKLQYLQKLNSVLAKFQPDVVHCHSNKVFQFFLPLKLLHPNIKVYLTIHDTKIYRDFSSIERILQKNFLTGMIAISSAVKKDIIDGGFPENKVSVVYNGIDPQKFSSNERRDYAENRAVKVLVCVARLVPAKKGQDILIKALSILNKTQQDFICYLIGEAPYENPEYRTQLETLINDYELSEKVILLGNRNDVPDILANSNVFILPSRYEGFGISLIEAMFARLPVIASAIDGPVEIIKDNEYGYLFESENYEMLANVIAYVLNNDNTDRIDAAYAYANKYFSIQSMVDSLESVYRGVDQL